jgi:aspartate-semialdehyde dehydrogenase
LFSESGISPDSLVLLDDNDHQGERRAFGNTYLKIEDQHAYDYEDVLAVLLLSNDKELESLLQHADCAVIGHAISPEAEANSLNPVAIEDIPPGLSRIAGAEVATLVQVLGALVKDLSATSLQVVNVLSAALYGQAAVESLASQTVALLNSQDPAPGPFNQQLAFNMLPRPADPLTQAQLAELLDPRLEISMHSIVAAALHGMVQSVDISFADPVELSAIGRLLGQVGELRSRDSAVSPLSDCRHGAKPVIYDLHHPQNDAKRVHFWIIADSIRNGLAQNYLRLMRVLLKSFS